MIARKNICVFVCMCVWGWGGKTSSSKSLCYWEHSWSYLAHLVLREQQYLVIQVMADLSKIICADGGQTWETRKINWRELIVQVSKLIPLVPFPTHTTQSLFSPRNLFHIPLLLPALICKSDLLSSPTSTIQHLQESLNQKALKQKKVVRKHEECGGEEAHVWNMTGDQQVQKMSLFLIRCSPAVCFCK